MKWEGKGRNKLAKWHPLLCVLCKNAIEKKRKNTQIRKLKLSSR
jgi:hypothetical protein